MNNCKHTSQQKRCKTQLDLEARLAKVQPQSKFFVHSPKRICAQKLEEIIQTAVAA
jgi:hypothetical protein